MSIKRMIFGAAVCFALCGVVQAQTVTALPKPSVLSIIGRQCGQPPVTSVATGFNGAYLTTQNSATTRCGGSGRGGGYHTTTYSGCATATYTLTGKLSKVTGGCPIVAPDPGVVFTNDLGYSLATVNSTGVLTAPAVTPQFTWTGAGDLTAVVGQSLSVTVNLVNNGSVPLHIYSVSAGGSWLNNQASGCAEVDLNPGETCAVSATVFPGNGELTSTTIVFSASTDAPTESTFYQLVKIQEAPEPIVTTTPLAIGSCDVSAGVYCVFVQPDSTLPNYGGWIFDDVSWSIVFYNFDGTVSKTEPLVNVSVTQDASTGYFFVSAYNADIDIEAQFVQDPVTLLLSFLQGTVTTTALL